MKGKLFVALSFTVVGLATSALAHHGNAGYDMVDMTVKKATIVEFDWTNPHCQIHFDVTDNKGNVTHWTVEAPPPTMLVERGWNHKSVKPGDSVTAYFHAAKNGAPVGILQRFVTVDGTSIWAYPETQSQGQQQQKPPTPPAQ